MMKIISHKNFIFCLLVCSVAAYVSGSVQARQFRQVVPIATAKKIKSALPDGAVAIKQAKELEKGQITEAVNQVLSKWNSGDLEQVLSDDFFDKSRLTDAVDSIVPRDAALRVQSVQGVQTLQQYIMPTDEGDTMVSIVSATVNTQLEFNDPASGLVRLPGVNEFVLKVTQPAPR
ncbi:MAG: hypothetical protein HN764_04180 [Gammaproteobacteria bacterium]|nr:hypothetical protein [Gammaproteobacteria bacterium]